MLNNYFEIQSIWNTLSTKKLVLSSEKGSESWARTSSAWLQIYILAQGAGKNLSKIWQIWLKGRANKCQ